METRSGSGDFDDVFGLEPLRALHHVKADAVSLAQGPEPLGDDGGVVDEDVRAALPHDEAIALGVVKPLHGTLLRNTLLPCNKMKQGCLFSPPVRRPPPPHRGAKS